MGLDKTGTGDLELRFTMLGDDRGVSLELHDRLSGQGFLTIKLTPEEFLHAFAGRLACLTVKGEFSYLERIGKKMVMDKITFPLPPEANYKNRQEIAKNIAPQFTPEGWTPDTYYGSRESFDQRNLVTYATTIIRKWVDEFTGN